MDSYEELLLRVGELEKQNQYRGDNFRALQAALTNAGLDGDAVNIGTYIIGPTGDAGATYTFAYPATAKALNVRLSAKWAAAADTSYADLRPNGATGTAAGAFVRARVANVIWDDCGSVSLDGNGRALLTVAGANTTWTEVYITGYLV